MGTNKISMGTRTKLSTARTDLAGVVRLNLFYNDAFHVGFVGDEALQLVEAPVTNPIIHHSPSSFISYSFEVFQNNLSTIKTFNDAFADVVINPSHITSFSSRDFLKQSLAGTSAFSLELSSEIFESSLCLLHNTTIKEPCVTCDGEVVYSEVNAQNNVLRTVVLLNGTNLFRESEQEESPAFLIQPKKTLADFPSEVFFITFRNGEWYLDSAFDRGNAQDIIFEACTAREIVPHRTPANNWFSFGLLDHSAALFDASNSKLALQSKLSELSVNKWVEFDVIPNSFFPCRVNAELQSSLINSESGGYFRSGFNLDFCSHNSSHKVSEDQEVFKPYAGICPVASGLKRNGGWQFIQRINSLVSLPYIS